MGILIISDQDRQTIRTAIEAAKANPMPLAVGESVGFLKPRPVLELADFNPRGSEVRTRYPVQRFVLGNYRVSFSYEEQPAGYVRHLSVSCANAESGMVPNKYVMQMLAEEFGFSAKCILWTTADGKSLMWNEEYEPGCYAINVIELDEEYEKVPETTAARISIG